MNYVAEWAGSWSAGPRDGWSRQPRAMSRCGRRRRQAAFPARFYAPRSRELASTDQAPRALIGVPQSLLLNYENEYGECVPALVAVAPYSSLGLR